MPTMYEIQASFLADHDALGTRANAPDKELFDRQHGQVWADCDIALKARLVDLEARPELSPEEEIELVELLDLFPPTLPPDADTVRAGEILATSPDVISMPQVWELLRIMGRRLGY